MSEQVRQRKKGGTGKQRPVRTEEEDTKKQQQPGEGPVDLEPNIYVAIGLVLAFFAVLGVLAYYKIDQRNNGPFYSFINDKILPKNRYQKIS